jgi:hypothetical protein
MQQQQKLYNKLYNLIINNKDGFTSNKNADILNLNKGFAVSVTNNSEKDINLLINKAIDISKFFKNFCFGGWYDSENKNYYLDISFILDDKIKAIDTAKTFKQLAIFDFQNLNSINV